MVIFDDGKDESALRTIGEVSAATGIRTHVLRYWEQQFPELRPLTRSGGRRYYRPQDVALIQRIDLLVNRQGYTIRGARAALELPAAVQAPITPPATAAAETGDIRSSHLQRLRSIRDDLSRALNA